MGRTTISSNTMHLIIIRMIVNFVKMNVPSCPTFLYKNEMDKEEDNLSNWIVLMHYTVV